MKTIVHTKIFAIKQSAKGWSDYHSFHFNKVSATKELRKLNEWKNKNKSQINFRLYEIQCEDSIIYTTTEE